MAHAENRTATTTALDLTANSATVTSVPAKTVVTLTATVATGSGSVTTGQVRFCDADAQYCTDIHLIGTAQLTSTGKAVFKFVPGPGEHSYKAVFAGNTADAASTSSTAGVTVGSITPVYADTTAI